MNRREAIEALLAVPGVARVSLAEVRTGDFIVLTVPKHVPEDVLTRLKATAEQVFAEWGCRVVVLTDGTQLSVLRRPL